MNTNVDRTEKKNNTKQGDGQVPPAPGKLLIVVSSPLQGVLRMEAPIDKAAALLDLLVNELDRMAQTKHQKDQAAGCSLLAAGVQRELRSAFDAARNEWKMGIGRQGI